MIAKNKLAEQLALDSIWVDDHLLNYHDPPENRFEVWTTLFYLGSIGHFDKIFDLIFLSSVFAISTSILSLTRLVD
jgi:hypothetical protein